MFDILSFFTEDTTTYSESNIVMYVFDETRTDEFIMNSLDSYRYAYISDEDLSENVEKMGTARSEEIKEVLPTDPIIQSGEFAEILTFMLFYALYPEYNVAPLRWRWKEEKNRAVHFADIMLLSCPDEEHPKDTDKVMTVEVKSRATRPGKRESSINNAIVGALKDSISREGKTLSFLLQRYKRDNSSMTEAQKDHWRAVGYFFHSFWYMELIDRFGDVPWVDQVLQEDSPEAYGPRVDRKTVADKVLERLQWTAQNISNFSLQDCDNTITQASVLASISRFALRYGT